MSRRKSARRELEDLAAKYQLSFDGYTSKGHLRWRHEPTNRTMVTTSWSTSWRAIKNAERDFKAMEAMSGQHDHAH